MDDSSTSGTASSPLSSDESDQSSPNANGCDTVIIDMAHADIPEDVDVEKDLTPWFEGICRKYSMTHDPWRGFHVAMTSLTMAEPLPVAFPTETVYGLGADATNENAVRGIFAAKNRPTDNPLIVHFASLPQIRHYLGDIPKIYDPLIKKFWPGALTIIMRLPEPSPFAPSVTNQLGTVGIRMPSTPIARLLISVVDKPLAAPSANTSTKPSPTTARHVLNDMKGRICYILDGGPCQVGLESTVVDGLSNPPLVLRPGGISIDAIRTCGGEWANVGLGYSDQRLAKHLVPRAPGMKYKHYAPTGRVLLFEAGVPQGRASTKLCYHLFHKNANGIRRHGAGGAIGVITTASWDPFLGIGDDKLLTDMARMVYKTSRAPEQPMFTMEGEDLLIARRTDWPAAKSYSGMFYNIDAGKTAEEVARRIFAALRALDQLECQLIIVEGISEANGELAAAVMNRLRKAAE
jgi:L-threonylcarbamoyladenylate synthase